MGSQRQGKIARLPFAIREQLNLRILNGERGSTILPWLNGLPEVSRILEEDFEGLFVSDNNLTNWRQGGYEDWRKRRESIERTKELATYSISIAQAAGGNLTEGAAAILSGKVLEAIELLDGLLKPGADGQKPDLDAASITGMAEALAGLSESLTALRTGDQNNRRLRQNDEKLEILRKRLAQTEEALQLAQKKFQRSSCELFVKWFDDQRVKGILAGAEANDIKTEKLGQVIFGEDWK